MSSSTTSDQAASTGSLIAQAFRLAPSASHLAVKHTTCHIWYSSRSFGTIAALSARKATSGAHLLALRWLECDCELGKSNKWASPVLHVHVVRSFVPGASASACLRKEEHHTTASFEFELVWQVRRDCWHTPSLPSCHGQAQACRQRKQLRRLR